MGQERVNGLSVLFIESHILHANDVEKVIPEFADFKLRKKNV